MTRLKVRTFGLFAMAVLGSGLASGSAFGQQQGWRFSPIKADRRTRTIPAIEPAVAPDPLRPRRPRLLDADRDLERNPGGHGADRDNVDRSSCADQRQALLRRRRDDADRHGPQFRRVPARRRTTVPLRCPGRMERRRPKCRADAKRLLRRRTAGYHRLRPIDVPRQPLRHVIATIWSNRQ